MIVFGVISCSATKPLPSVFENIVQPGVENAPSVEVVLDTTLPPAPEKVEVYEVINIFVDEEYANNTAKQLGFDGGPLPVKTGEYRQVFSYKSGNTVLEVNIDGYIAIRHDINLNISQEFPPDQELIDRAQEWFSTLGLYPDIVFDYVEIAPYIEVDGKTIAKMVKLRKNINGYAIAGSGVSVIIGESQEIVGLEAYIPELKVYTDVQLRTPEDALQVLKSYLSSSEGASPQTRECLVNMRAFDRLIINNITIQYKINGDYAQPVYVFEGDSINNYNPGVVEHFIGMVDAVKRDQ